MVGGIRDAVNALFMLLVLALGTVETELSLSSSPPSTRQTHTT